MREKRRDKAFTADASIYNARMESYIATKPNADEFGSRFRLFSAADGLMSRLYRIDMYFGKTILDGDIRSPDWSKSEQSRVRDDYGLGDLYWCASRLKAFAHLASLEFVYAWRLYDHLKQFVDYYDIPPENPLLATMQKKRSPRPGVRRKAALAVRTRLKTISSRKSEIAAFEKVCELELAKLRTGEDKRYIWELTDAADEYFRQSDSPSASFPEKPPVRGARDWWTVTWLLGVLQRLAGLTPTATG